MAFLIGATSRFGSVKAFCIYCGVGIFLDFLFQCTFFLGFMVYDSRRIKYGHCRSISNLQPELPQTGGASQVSEPINDDKLDEFGINKNASSKIMEILANIILKNIWTKLLVLIIFAGYLGGAIYGLFGLQAGQDPFDLTPFDSYLRPYWTTFEVNKLHVYIRVIFW